MLEDTKKKHWFLLLLCLCFCLCSSGSWRVGRSVAAVACSGTEETRSLIPVGQTVGMKLFSHGVMVVALSEVKTAEGNRSPAQACGLRVGDIITQIAQEPVNTIEEVEAVLQGCGGATMAITALRGGRTMSLTTEAVCLSDGSYKLGAWVRDSMAGIGTVTWYDPERGTFAALGHGITDLDTHLLMPLKSGGLMQSSVTSIVKGSAGHPGQLHGTFDLSSDLGRLTANTDRGVFGTAAPGVFTGEAVPVASRKEVHTGRAVIRSNIEGTTVREYDVEILRIYPDTMSTSQNLMIEVTDPELLEATGGVVQGMSGSPILQDGKLVGAVTHVLVNDPTRGYGILLENMLDEVG